MKIITKILIGVLSITVLVPLKIAILCLFDINGAKEFFELSTINTDLTKLLIVCGGLFLATVILQVMAIIWLIRRNAGGFALSFLVGAIFIIRGLLTFVAFTKQGIDDPKLMIVPCIIGAVIILLTVFAKKT